MADEVTLRDYVDVQVTALREKIEAQDVKNTLHFSLTELAVKKAEEKIDGRLEGLNEWRDQNKDERTSLATKESVLVIDGRVKALELEGAKISGKADQSEVFSTKLIAIIGVVIGITGIAISLLR